MSSLYERLGGADAVHAAVDKFYDKVLGDESLSPFFAGVDMERMRAHQRAMLTVAFGGPNSYSGRGLGPAHAGLVARGMTDAHYDQVVGHLGATLTELGVPSELVEEAAGVAESVRPQVMGRA